MSYKYLKNRDNKRSKRKGLNKTVKKMKGGNRCKDCTPDNIRTFPAIKSFCCSQRCLNATYCIGNSNIQQSKLTAEELERTRRETQEKIDEVTRERDREDFQRSLVMRKARFYGITPYELWDNESRQINNL